MTDGDEEVEAQARALLRAAASLAGCLEHGILVCAPAAELDAQATLAARGVLGTFLRSADLLCSPGPGGEDPPIEGGTGPLEMGARNKSQESGPEDLPSPEG